MIPQSNRTAQPRGKPAPIRREKRSSKPGAAVEPIVSARTCAEGTMKAMPVSSAVLDPRHVLASLRAFKKGDYSVRLPGDLYGLDGEIACAFNDIVDLNESITHEYARIRDVVGKGGQITQ